jgi:hypothetical protein
MVLDTPPQRVVSLVPSVTESLFDLGLGEAVVGVTDFCVHPAGMTAALPKVGGTKNARVDDILALQPDLVVANQEENTQEVVEGLAAVGVPVWLTFPKTVDDAIRLLYDIAELFRNQNAMLAVRSLAGSVDYVRLAAADLDPVRTFCPIWFDRTSDGELWWMTFNADTYPHDLLRLLGMENVFADRTRRYPLAADLDDDSPQRSGRPEGSSRSLGARDDRYPRVSGDEIAAAAPELVLLPSEPFAFKEGDERSLRDILGDEVRYVFCDGSLLTWHGTRLAKALQLSLEK